MRACVCMVRAWCVRVCAARPTSQAVADLQVVQNRSLRALQRSGLALGLDPWLAKRARADFAIRPCVCAWCVRALHGACVA